MLRAGYGIYYNPNQMNSFTFLTNNPPIAAVATFSSDPANPTLSFERPFGVAGPGGPPDMISPTRDLPNSHKHQWSVDLQRELWPGTALDLQYVGSNTKNLDRSFFNNTPQPGPGAVDPRRPSQRFRSRRIIQNDLIADYDAVSLILRKRMSHGLQADAHYTFSRTRDMSTHSNGGGQTMNNYDIWADYGPANWDIPHRFVASYIYDVPFLKSSEQPILKYVVAGWQIGGVTTLQSGSPINVTISTDRANIGISGLQRPDLVGAVPELNCQPTPTGRDLDQLLRRRRVCAAGAVHVWQRAAQSAARAEVDVDRPVDGEERPARRQRAAAGAHRDVQRVQQRQLRQPGVDVRCGDVRPHQLGREHAADAAGSEADLLGLVVLVGLVGPQLPRRTSHRDAETQRRKPFWFSLCLGVSVARTFQNLRNPTDPTYQTTRPRRRQP